MPSATVGIQSTVMLWATPPRQNVPGGHGCGRAASLSCGSDVIVPSGHQYPGGHSLTGTDRPRLEHTKPAGHASGKSRP